MSNNTLSLVVYAIHPIMYQTPIFRVLQRRIEQAALPLHLTVLFGDDISLRPVYFDEINTTFQPDTPTLMEGYDYVLMPNFARDSRTGFLSRINPSVFAEIRRRRADIVLVHGYESLTAWLMVFAAKLSGARLIWRGEVTPRAPRSGLKAKLRRALLRFYLKRFDALMYSCSGNRAFLEDILGHDYSGRPTFAIPCAVDNAFFQAERARLMPERCAIRAELGIGPDDIVTMTCARLTPRKRPMDLLEAIARLGDPRFVALIVGDGPERAKLESYAQDLGIRTVFAGFVNQSQVSRYFVAADCFAILSDYDPSPKALNEAMNFSLPVIATMSVGTARDLVDPARNGWRVSVGDISAISDAISSLTNATVAQALGAESLAIVEEWNFEVDATGLLKAFAHVTDRPDLVPFNPKPIDGTNT